MKNLRFAHLSDLHFGTVDFGLKQFLSKKWIGNLNFSLFRQKSFITNDLKKLPALFDKLNVETVFFTGDFSSTSSDQEFEKASSFLQNFHSSIFTCPGNHDCYIKKNETEQTYYQYFKNELGVNGFSLKNDRVFGKKIKEGFYGIMLDCALATPPFNAFGVFFPEMGDKLESILNAVPQTDKIILGNHFPLFPSKRKSHDLKNCEQLQQILKRHPNVILYLHGHNHNHYIIEPNDTGLPLVLNCGSSTYKKNHAFYLVDIKEKEIHIAHYFFREGKWSAESEYSRFNLK